MTSDEPAPRVKKDDPFHVPTRAERTGPARWFTGVILAVAVVHALGLASQLFFVQLLPPGRTDPFAELPWFIYAIEAYVLAVSGVLSFVRLTQPERSLLVSTIGAVLLIPFGPWGLVAIVWLVRERKRERDWARSYQLPSDSEA